MTMDSSVSEFASASTCPGLNGQHTRLEKNQQPKLTGEEQNQREEQNNVHATTQDLFAQILDTVRCEAARSAKLQVEIRDEITGIQEETAGNSAELLVVKQVLNEIRQSLSAHVRASDNDYSSLAGQAKAVESRILSLQSSVESQRTLIESYHSKLTLSPENNDTLPSKICDLLGVEDLGKQTNTKDSSGSTRNLHEIDNFVDQQEGTANHSVTSSRFAISQPEFASCHAVSMLPDPPSTPDTAVPSLSKEQTSASNRRNGVGRDPSPILGDVEHCDKRTINYNKRFRSSHIITPPSRRLRSHRDAFPKRRFAKIMDNSNVSGMESIAPTLPSSHTIFDTPGYNVHNEFEEDFQEMEKDKQEEKENLRVHHTTIPRDLSRRPNSDRHEDIPRVHQMSSIQGTNRSEQNSDSTHTFGKDFTLPKYPIIETKAATPKQHPLGWSYYSIGFRPVIPAYNAGQQTSDYEKLCRPELRESPIPPSVQRKIHELDMKKHSDHRFVSRAMKTCWMSHNFPVAGFEGENEYIGEDECRMCEFRRQELGEETFCFRFTGTKMIWGFNRGDMK